jgi:beta-1,4-mannosyl-glycoprotein beta-1,4-N-acetylglucosaminyltransferase
LQRGLWQWAAGIHRTQRLRFFAALLLQRCLFKWVGTIVFNRSQSTVTKNIITILQSTKNDVFSFRYNIIDNGYFFQSSLEEIITDFTSTDYRGIKLKHRFEVSKMESFPKTKKLRPKKIIDCFIFNNEIDLLKQRFKLLDRVVDHFVLVEAKQTHSGLGKETYFENFKSEFSEFLHKIEHVVVDLPNQFLYETTESEVEEYLKINWFRENYHRNEILRGLYNLDLIDYDVILISDLDEIPDPLKLNKFIDSIPNGEFRIQTQKWYCWDLNRLYNNTWPGTAAIRWNDLKKTTPQIIRSKRYDNQYKINEEIFGWHCSWFGGINQTMSKLSSFAHQELKDITIEDIENKMTMNLDIHGQVLLDNNDGYDPEFI